MTVAASDTTTVAPNLLLNITVYNRMPTQGISTVPRQRPCQKDPSPWTGMEVLACRTAMRISAHRSRRDHEARMSSAPSIAVLLRTAILIIAIVAAIVTPTPDATTMLIFMAPMLGLYYVGIGVAWTVVRNKAKKAAIDGKGAG